MNNNLSINDIFLIVWKKVWWLILSIIIFTLIFTIYAFKIVKPEYRATGSIMIQVESNEGNTNTTESQRLVKSTVDILMKMNLIPEETSKTLKSNGYDVSKGTIRSNMTVSSAKDSLVITISYISTNQDETKIVVDEIINTLIRVTNDEKYNMDKTLKNNISKLYVSEAQYYSPNKPLLIFLGMVIGGVVGLILIITNEVVNSGYKEKDEIEEELKIQVLGVIPNFEVKRGNE